MKYFKDIIFFLLDLFLIKFFGKHGVKISQKIRTKPKVGYLLFGLIIVGGTFYVFRNKVKSLFVTQPTIEFVSKNKNTLKVLVLPFKNYENSNLKIAESITDRLKEKIESENLNLEVIYDSISPPTILFNEARKIAFNKKIIPDLVIFGEYEKNDYKINLLNISKDSIFTQFYTHIIPQTLIGKYFKIHRDKPIKPNIQLNDIEYIIYKIAFLTAIKNNDCEKAENLGQLLFKMFNQYSNNYLIDRDYIINNLILCNAINHNIDRSLQLANWYVLSINPDSFETRFIRLILLIISKINKENNDANMNLEKTIILNEIKILKKADSEFSYPTYIISAFFELLSGNYNQVINELEVADSIEQVNKLNPPISTFILNIIKGNFEENKILYDSIDKINNAPKSTKYVFFTVHDFFIGNLQNVINDLNNLNRFSKYEYNMISDSTSLKIITQFCQYFYSDFNIDFDSLYISSKNINTNDPWRNINNAIFLTGCYLYDVNNIKYAIKNFKHAITLKPEWEKYFNFNNLPKDSVIKIKNIISKNKHIIHQHPSDYIALSKISNSYKKLGYEFISKYYKIKAINANHLALIYLDTITKNQKELFKWKKFFRSSDSLIKHGINKGINYFNRAIAFLYFQKQNLAQKDFYSSLKHKVPDTLKPYIHYYLCSITFAQKNYSLSLEHCNKLIALKPYHPIGYYYKSLIYENFYDYEEALINIDKAIKFYKSYKKHHKEKNIFIPIDEFYKVKKRVEPKAKYFKIELIK